MDGYHYTRAKLDAFADPAHAHARRGAEFTFDGPAFLKLVQALRAPLGAGVTASIFAPSFDHARKDPVDDDIEVRPSHRVVVFEGNYVCLDLEPWRSAAALMDLRCFVEVEEPVARERLAARHVLAGIVATREDGLRRADENDLVNGRQITEHKVPNIDFTVYSREDGQWK
jgi:pantothenate kinase